MPERKQNQRRQGGDRMNGMQRVPSDAHRSAPKAEQGSSRAAEQPPLLALARRIREEQGIEGLKDFLAAMAPFAAPYELKNVASLFGMNYESIRPTSEKKAAFAPPARGGAPETAMGAGMGNTNAGGTGMGLDPRLMQMFTMLNGRGGAGMGGMNGMGGMGGMMQMMQLMRMMPAFGTGAGANANEPKIFKNHGE